MSFRTPAKLALLHAAAAIWSRGTRRQRVRRDATLLSHIFRLYTETHLPLYISTLFIFGLLNYNEMNDKLLSNSPKTIDDDRWTVAIR